MRHDVIIDKHVKVKYNHHKNNKKSFIIQQNDYAIQTVFTTMIKKKKELI